MSKSPRAAPFNDHTWTQASEWLLRFSEEEVDAAAREQFNGWLRNSPENVHAYLQVAAFWREADRMGRQDGGSHDIDTLVARAQQEANVYLLAKPSFEAGPPSSVAANASQASFAAPATVAIRKRRRWLAAASVALAAGIGAAIGYSELSAPVYRTGIGEQRILNLSDGSTVTLNASSRLTLHFSSAERAIELSQGQALFKVARNAARPFVVRSGDTSARAVGTQFEVYKKKAGTVVTVVEGKVAVTSAPSTNVVDVLVTAGERITISAAAHRRHPAAGPPTPSPPTINRIEPKDAVAWTEGLLVFEAAPLEEVVQEFNRQNSRPLVLEGKGLDTVRITGTFPANGSGRITRFLQERHGVVVHETDDEIRISRP